MLKESLSGTETIIIIFKHIRYGWLLDYHLKKQYKYSSDKQTVLKYHFEMAENYYEKIYGENQINNKLNGGM